MVLTRVGQDSKIIVNGDLKQSDLTDISGLSVAKQIFSDTEEIAFQYFNVNDVVRSKLCQLIGSRFENWEAKNNYHID